MTENLAGAPSTGAPKTKPSKRKMRPGGGKSKGNSFENVIAKKLSTALHPLKFIRTQGSGARVGGKNFEALGQMFGEEALKLFVGDVVPVNEKEAGVQFRFSIECKSYKTPDNFPSLVSGTSNVFKWMQESEDDAVKIKREPLLIFKWNNINSMVGSFIETPCHRLVLEAKGQRKIFISYLDELVEHCDFWYANLS